MCSIYLMMEIACTNHYLPSTESNAVIFSCVLIRFVCVSPYSSRSTMVRFVWRIFVFFVIWSPIIILPTHKCLPSQAYCVMRLADCVHNRPSNRIKVIRFICINQHILRYIPQNSVSCVIGTFKLFFLPLLCIGGIALESANSKRMTMNSALCFPLFFPCFLCTISH